MVTVEILYLSYGSKFRLACVQTSPPPSGKNRERRRRFFPEGGGDVFTQASLVKLLLKTYRFMTCYLF